MTLQQLFSQMTMDPLPITLYFIGLPILVFLLNWVAKDESNKSPWNYVYSTLIFLVCIPGTFSVILCGYSMFFQPQSLLQVNAFVYFLPIVSMISTVMIAKQETDINRLPGFNKLSGLVMLLAVTFIAMLLIQKTRIWVVFAGNMGSLLILFLVLFVLFRIAWSRLMYSSNKAGIK